MFENDTRKENYMDCIFCNVDAIKENIIYEGKHSYLLADKYPATLGHMLIIPKAHCASVNDLPIDVGSDIMLTKKVAINILEGKLNISSYNIVLAHGKNARQSVKHVHYHIIPRTENDNLTIDLNEDDDKENYIYNRNKLIEIINR